MILAKPLKTKGLGRLRGPADSTRPESDLNCLATGNELSSNRIKTDDKVISSQLESKDKVKLRSLKGNITNLILGIVELQHGINASDTQEILRKFCRLKGYQFDAMELGVHQYLKQLTDKGIITRTKINEVFYYFKKVA